MKAWILGLILIAFLAAVGFVTYFTVVWGKKSLAAELKVERIRQQVTEEVKTLPNGHWAGHYLYGSEHDVRRDLWIAPKAGFAFESHASFSGLFDRNFGRVQEKDGRIHLDFDFKDDIMPSDYLFIRWGKRRYLIATDRMIDFCNVVNSENESYLLYNGGFGLNVEDKVTKKRERPNVAPERYDPDLVKQMMKERGWPDVPAKYRPYLLKQPIVARITKIVKGSTDKVSKVTFRHTIVEIDAGKKDGVLPGMKFHLQPRLSGNPFVSAIVKKVDDDSCEAEITDLGSTTPPPLPKVGRSVSTSDCLINGRMPEDSWRTK